MKITLDHISNRYIVKVNEENSKMFSEMKEAVEYIENKISEDLNENK